MNAEHDDNDAWIVSGLYARQAIRKARKDSQYTIDSQRMQSEFLPQFREYVWSQQIPQHSVASALGISTAYVSLIMAGRKKVATRVLLAMSAWSQIPLCHPKLAKP